jgi:chaperonin GroES
MSFQKLQEFIDKPNLTDELADEKLVEIGNKIISDYELDKTSRAPWEQINAEAMKLAKQVMEEKTFPWKDASNVKYPLVIMATIQLAATAYSQLIVNDRIVKAHVKKGVPDPDGQLEKQANIISDYMSEQLLIDNNTWEEGMDKLLHSWPILGTSFKKLYYDPITKEPCYDLCNPDDVVVNNNIKSLETARRITHKVYYHKNDIIERIRAGIFRDVDLEKLTPTTTQASELAQDTTGQPITSTSQDADGLLEFLEQHNYLDLDDDGYQEPYITTVHKDSGTVFRIVPRYDLDSIVLTEKEEIQRIEPINYFTDYHFIPSPDGGYYSIGFGTLLTPINKSINTLINQLIDAGTLANVQSGFANRALKPDNGEIQLEMGRFVYVNASRAESLANQILPLPFKEPSQVLFSLLGLMIQTGKELANITEIMTGEQQVQNVPATTMLETLRQGLKVFNSIQRRLFRSLKKEFEILYRINRVYGNPEIQQLFASNEINVKPVADPNLSSSAEKMARLNALPMAAQAFPGAINVPAAAVEYLTGLEFKNVEKLIVQPDPQAPPPPDVQAKLTSAQAADKNATANLIKAQTTVAGEQRKAVESAAKVKKMETDAIENLANAEAKRKEIGISAYHKTRELDIKDKQVDLSRLKRANGS